MDDKETQRDWCRRGGLSRSPRKLEALAKNCKLGGKPPNGTFTRSKRHGESFALSGKGKQTGWEVTETDLGFASVTMGGKRWLSVIATRGKGDGEWTCRYVPAKKQKKERVMEGANSPPKEWTTAPESPLAGLNCESIQSMAGEDAFGDAVEYIEASGWSMAEEMALLPPGYRDNEDALEGKLLDAAIELEPVLGSAKQAARWWSMMQGASHGGDARAMPYGPSRAAWERLANFRLGLG